MQDERSSTSGLRIIVMGYIVRGPLGGITWHHLQYLTGLAALGHCVHFLEDSDDYASCYNPARNETSTDPSYGLRYAAKVFPRFGFGERWAYHDAHTGTWHGPRAGDMIRLCGEADLLLNLSGINPLRPWVEAIPARALIDTDPVFTQIRHLQDPKAMAYASAHTSFFSFGENFGQPGCTIPDDGFAWIPTRQPMVLDAWPVAAPAPGGRFTSVLQWDSYPAAEHAGIRYGMKSASFPAYAELPSHVGERLEMALGGPLALRAELAAKGWAIRNPLRITRDPWKLQDYLRGSCAEFSIAKHGYVASRSGWFSDRTAGYLASGRPVVAQDTGYSRWLGRADGVVPFTDFEEARAGIAEIRSNYLRHHRGARDVVETFFDARKVLSRLVALAPRTAVMA